MLPGFTDSHFHYFDWALNQKSVDLSTADSFENMKEMVRQKAILVGAGQWVTGYGFNETDWPENKIPNRDDLDSKIPDNPVCIWRCDLHLAVANSKALELAKIDENTPDPPMGVIAKDKNGRPTGVLREIAPNLVRNVIPTPDEDNLVEIMDRGFSFLHSLGMTGVHDIRLMGGLDGAASLRAWQRLRQENRIKVRCHVTLPGEMTDQAIALGLRTGMGDDLLRIGHLKFFADGGMGARTAWMNEPYLDAETGMPLTPIEELNDKIERADLAGLSVMVHAIGTRANREIVAIFKRIQDLNQSTVWIPHRIEHLQMIEPGDLDILATLERIVVCCQPNNLSLDISMIEQSVGEKSGFTYPLKSILNKRIPLVLSSDAPVCNPRPLSGIFSAVNRTRMNKTPAGGWHMEHALSVDEAVRAYTIAPVAAVGLDDRLGSITVGKYADLIVLDRDIYEINPLDIADVKIDMTVFNGKIVHDPNGS
jgi:predicted amidohydrolase YtcJ